MLETPSDGFRLDRLARRYDTVASIVTLLEHDQVSALL